MPSLKAFFVHGHVLWYPLAAAVLTGLIALWKRVPESVRVPAWNKVPRRLQWLPAVATAGIGGFTDAFAQHAPWGVALATALYAVVAAGMTSVGLSHTWKRITGTGSKAASKASTTLTLLFVGSLFLSGCTLLKPAVPTPPDRGVEACRRQADRAYVSEAVRDCKGFASLSACPAKPKLDASHLAALEACRKKGQ